MIRFYITGQVLRLYTPTIAADTINYLTGKAEFADEAWDGYTKWVHFRKGETVYDIQLNDEDEFDENTSLNLVAGEWDVYFTGTSGNARLTTNTVVLTVTESGLRDSPLHALPLSVAETLDAKSSLALRTANSIKAKADAGEFNGKDGKSFTIVGYVQTAEDLPETGTEGEMYGVGSEAPYRIYAWDSVNGVWVDNGTIQGPAGEAGVAGKYAVPALDTSGNLTWEWSDGSEEGLPGQQNIRGGKGPAGAQGAAGKSAYAAAVEGGYLGDEAGFNAKLSTFDAHAASHAEGGSDELTDKSIGRSKLKDGAVTTYFDGELTTDGWNGSTAPYTQEVTISGMLASDKPKIGLIASAAYETAEEEREAWGYILDAETSENTLIFRAVSKPEIKLNFQCEVNRK